MKLNIGDRVKVIALETAEDDTDIQIGDTGIVIDIYNSGQEAVKVVVRPYRKDIEDAGNANCLADLVHRLWETQLESIE